MFTAQEVVLFLLYILFNRFKIRCGMFAKGTDEILGKRVALVDISADFAHKAFFALCLWLGLDIAVIVAVGHCFLVGDDSCFCYRADEHTVGVKVDILFNFERKE